MDQAPFSLGLVSHVKLAARSEPSFIEYFNIPSNARSPYYVYIHIPSYTYVCVYIYNIHVYITHRIRKEHSSSEMKLRTIGSTCFHHPERQPFDFPFQNPFSSKLQLNIRHFAALNHVSCDFWDPFFMPRPWLSCAAFATATGAKLTGIGALAKPPSACRKG